MRAISKSFAGTHALRGVDLTVQAGEVHGLVGENGAGKSTLMRILSGALRPDRGQVLLRGVPQQFPGPLAAQAAGIAMIHQELSLVPTTSVADNILLGHEPRSGLGLLRTAETLQQARDLMTALDTPLDVTRRVEAFPLATRQLIEVAKALSHRATLIIMDEPTSALPEQDATKLYGVIRRLRDRGVAIIYISHRMEEIYRLCDRLTVLRDGALVGSALPADLGQHELIRWMVGRDVDQLFPDPVPQAGAELLRVEDMTLEAADASRRRLVDRVSLSLRAGEIVGLAGLRGAGTGELMGCIAGRYGRRAHGRVFVAGRERIVRSPAAAIRAGIAMLTDDRKATGLVLSMSVLHNMTLAALDTLVTGGIIRRSRELCAARPLAASLALRARSLDEEVSALSGGNQQKVALAKWLLTEPRVLLLDEPTRGIDVAAKSEVYHLMRRLATGGCGILLTTPELPELIAMSDRILVMHRGRITAQLARTVATPEAVLAAAMELRDDE